MVETPKTLIVNPPKNDKQTRTSCVFSAAPAGAVSRRSLAARLLLKQRLQWLRKLDFPHEIFRRVHAGVGRVHGPCRYLYRI